MKNFKTLLLFSIGCLLFIGCDKDDPEIEIDLSPCENCTELITNYLNVECYDSDGSQLADLQSTCADFYEDWQLAELSGWAQEACFYNTVKSTTWDGDCTGNFYDNLSLGDYINAHFDIIIVDTFPGAFRINFLIQHENATSGSTGTLYNFPEGGKYIEYNTIWEHGFSYPFDIGFDIKRNGNVPSEYDIEFVNKEELYGITFNREDPTAPRKLVVNLLEIDEENKIFRYQYTPVNF